MAISYLLLWARDNIARVVIRRQSNNCLYTNALLRHQAMKMNVLVAEDDPVMTSLYRIALEAKGHHVKITQDGEECIRVYKEAFDNLVASGKKPSKYEPFDVVVLDYRMPKVDGLEAAKAILALNRNQRIVFASAFVKETLKDSVRHLEQIVELIQKPFEPKVLVDLVEDTSATRELEEINKLVADISTTSPDDEQINELLGILKRIQKSGL